MRSTTPDPGPAAAVPHSDRAGHRSRALPPLRTIAARAGRVAAVAAVAVGLTTAVATPTRAALEPTLTVRAPTGHVDHYEVRVSGVFPMSRADAQQHLARLGDGGVAYALVHDDHGADDIVQLRQVDRGAGRPVAGSGRSLYAAADGLHYSWSTVVHRDQLDEDDRWGDRTDEVYVRATFVDGDGRHWMGSTSNVVVDDF